MEELFRERIESINERLGEALSRLSSVERDNHEMKKALVILLSRLKRIEEKHKLRPMKRRG